MPCLYSIFHIDLDANIENEQNLSRLTCIHEPLINAPGNQRAHMCFPCVLQSCYTELGFRLTSPTLGDLKNETEVT